MLMLAAALFAIVGLLGNLLGAVLYETFGGFSACVAAITAVYALMLPVLLLVPKSLTATADGETPSVPFADA
jgi:hypothetical protein